MKTHSSSENFQVLPCAVIPELDPGFTPAVSWNAAYDVLVQASGGGRPLRIGIGRPGETWFRHDLRILPDEARFSGLTRRYVERWVKTLLWQKGGSRIRIAGDRAIADGLRSEYGPAGARAFDAEIVGQKMYREAMSVEACAFDDIPESTGSSIALGRHLEGCRIGFDLGGSDRKCAAVMDGKVVFSEEVPWNPYFEKNPEYHLNGIRDSLKRAAAHLPRVDAIGGSAAGVYVDNEVRVASLFRGVPAADFDRHVRRIFFTLMEEWKGIPFDVLNDGEVTALAGSMALQTNGLLGISMGTSLAAGYCDANGRITPWLNELAFAPVDYRESGPVDEWSGDRGCGVQFFSQQGVARLAPAARLFFPGDMPLAERLEGIQDKLKNGDERAVQIFETIGVCFGYAIAQYMTLYDLRHILVLGRVTSGEGGAILLSQAGRVLKKEFPELADKVNMSMPDENLKRHGQAIAAASLAAGKQEPLINAN
jgi:predicted NBD/HSP70 family sugar kinase